jgi:DNA mismatch endonuclease, patch repair protein
MYCGRRSNSGHLRAVCTMRPSRLKSSSLLPRRHRPALTRSEMMSRIRSKDTAPEIRVRSAVHACGLRFRNHVDSLPGKPDLANRRNRWAIYVHGCFWHSHRGCRLASKPRSNSAYWTSKLQLNIDRDHANVRELRRLGYRVLIVWECNTRVPSRLKASLRDFIVRLREPRPTAVRSP